MSENTSVFDEVKLKVDLVDYLTQYCDTEFVSDGPGRLAACCPFHQEDTPSFKVTDARSGEPYKTWRCYGACQAGGTIIDAVMMHEGLTTAFEAVEVLNDLYSLGLQQDRERYERFQKTVAEAKATIDRTQEEMASGSKAAQQARAYLHKRGLTDDTIDHFGLAVDTSKTKAGRLAIPIVDRANHPITVSSRALFDGFECAACRTYVTAKEIASQRHKAQRARERGEPVIEPGTCPECGAAPKDSRLGWLSSQHPKYLNERDYEKSKILYNEPTARMAMREDDVIGYFIMEGYGDVWACFQAGQRACSSYNGAQISEWQATEAAKLAMAVEPDKPIILIPDFDSTGLSKVKTNIEIIRAATPGVELQVVHSLEWNGASPKDLGELLQTQGSDAVATVLADRRISADEWLIREVVEAVNPKTGELFHSKLRQMELTSMVLGQVRHRAHLDHLIPELADTWGIPEAQARQFMYLNLAGADQLSTQHLMKDVEQAQREAQEFLREEFVIPHGFDEIDLALPGGGARTKQLCMFLGKSGTGKASPLDAHVLTPTGWRLMGDLAPGDLVTDPATGHGAPIISVHPQGERPVFRVHFDDGTSCECDEGHLWQVRLPGGSDWRVVDVPELMVLVSESPGQVEIPLTAPVHYDPSLCPDDATLIERVLARMREDYLEGHRSLVADGIDHCPPHVREAVLAAFFAGDHVVRTTNALLARELADLIRSVGGIARTDTAGEERVVHWVPAGAGRHITAIDASRRTHTQCILIDSQSHLYLTNDYIVTHNTMLMTQILANMARRGIRSIFFSLEQPAAQLYMRMTCQALDVRMDEGIELIKSGDPRLDEVNKLFANMIIIDNVPEADQPLVNMTPPEIMRIIQEVNMTRFPAPAHVVAIDHLGIVRVPDTAPRSVQQDDMQAAGYIMQELFSVCKIMDVYMMVLQQLPKEIRAGQPLQSDSGRGGSKQTDYCDYIYGIWRPEQREDLSDEERLAVEGQYKLFLAKNRHGASPLAHLYFDKKNLRITPALSIMPTHPEAGVLDVAEGEPVVVGADPGAASLVDESAADAISGAGEVDSGPPARDAAAGTESDPALPGEDVLESADPSVPTDSQRLLEMLGSSDGDDLIDLDYYEN